MPIFTAAIVGLVPAASATDILTIAPATPTGIIRILSLDISGIATTAASPDMLLIKRAPNTGGTSTAPPGVPLITGVPTAILAAYTVNPVSLGVAVGTMFARKLNLALAGAAQAPQSFNFSGSAQYQGLTLIGSGQVLAVNLGGATISGGSIDIDISWSE
jgi:hypothetical protein